MHLATSRAALCLTLSRSSVSYPPTSPTWYAFRATSLLVSSERCEHVEIFERRRVLLRVAAGGDITEKSSHDLARARLWERLCEADHVGLGDRAENARDVFAERTLQRIARREAWRERNERCDARAFDVVRHANDGRLDHGFVRDERAFDFHRAESVARHVDDVVDAAHDPEVAAVVATRAVACEIHPLHARPVRVDETLAIAVNAAQHRWPRLADHEQSAGIRGEFVAVLIDDGRVDSKEGKRARTWNGRRRARERRDDVSTRFGLPERVNDRALRVADLLVVPDPRFRIDRFTNGAEDLQAREIVLRGMFIAPLHERANRRWCRVEVRHAVARDHLPEAVIGRPVRRAFEHQGGHAIREDAVDDVRVPRDPTDVGGAPVDVARTRAQIEGLLRGVRGVHHVAADCVANALRLTCRARRVEQEEEIFRIHRLTLAFVALCADELVPRVVAASRPVDGIFRAMQDDAVLDRVILRGEQMNRFVDVLLQRHDLSASPRAVAGDDDARLRVEYAVDDRRCREPAENHAVCGADAGAREHRDGEFRHHAHVERDDVALLHAERFQRVRATANFF